MFIVRQQSKFLCDDDVKTCLTVNQFLTPKSSLPQYVLIHLKRTKKTE